MTRVRPVAGWIAAVALAATATPLASPDAAHAALAKLEAGNARFVAQASATSDLGPARRGALTAGQHPFATIISCADSRVPPEHIFNVGLGDLFVIRVAGEVADRAVLASAEYAAEHLDVPLLVVLGHESCGAVTATVESDGKSLGPNLDYMRDAIREAIGRSAADRMELRAAILANVEGSVNALLTRSHVLRERVAHGELQIVGGYYELATGRVVFSSPVDAAQVSATFSKR